MRRRRFTWSLLTIVSTTLCALAAGLWITSYWGGDTISANVLRTRDGTWFNDVWEIQSSRGRLHFALDGWEFPRSWNATRVQLSRKVRWSYMHLAYGRSLDNPPTRTQQLGLSYLMDDSGSPYHYWVMLPDYLFVIVFAMPVGFAIVRGRRRKVGGCPICGYDLRATPDRCPECGYEVVAAAPVAAPTHVQTPHGG